MTALKKYFIVLSCLAMLTACGGNSSSEGSKTDTSAKKEEAPAAGAGDITANPDYQKGLDLIAKSDCLTCHDPLTKKIGPAYQEVADKYAGSDTALVYLSKKVISGGQGVWGTVPMTPHPALSQADAEQMVKYVLLLKTK